MDLIANYTVLKTKLGNWTEFRRKYSDLETKDENNGKKFLKSGRDFQYKNF